MEKNEYLFAMTVLSIVFVLVFIGCDHEDNECDPGNYCNWKYIEPKMDYSLPQFYIEGNWKKENGSEELSINTYAHFWKRYSATCPYCRAEIDAPLPVFLFWPYGSGDYIDNIPLTFFFNELYDGTAMNLVHMNDSILSFSAIVSNNNLNLSGLLGTFPFFGDGSIDVSIFNGSYTLISRPPSSQ
jgi:hypothetical protein